MKICTQRLTRFIPFAIFIFMFGISKAKSSLLSRLRSGLNKTRTNVGESLANLLLGKKEIDNALLEELETILLTSDVGVETTRLIIEDLTKQVNRKTLADSEALLDALKKELISILTPVSQPLMIPEKNGVFVILMVGINGAGKTTTIGKLAKQLQNQGKKVILAAGDTFRAAAVEQLKIWGERNHIPVIAQPTGSDSASVMYDAMEAAKARGCHVLIADTAGRLHTQHNLMEELKKIIRVMKKHDETAPHEIMLVLDGGIGQNAIQQAKQFNEAVNVTGITITKLDGTAKGGILFSIAKQLHLPIRYIGVGESIDDLQSFKAEEFVEAIVNLR